MKSRRLAERPEVVHEALDGRGHRVGEFRHGSINCEHATVILAAAVIRSVAIAFSSMLGMMSVIGHLRVSMDAMSRTVTFNEGSGVRHGGMHSGIGGRHAVASQPATARPPA